MMLFKRQSILALVASSVLVVSVFFSSVTFAQDSSDAQDSSEADEIAAIRSTLNQSQPNMLIDEIKPSLVAGLYEVSLEDGQVLYASADAKYFIPGDLYAVSPFGLVNLGEERRDLIRAARVAAIDESEMIIFEAEGERKATLTVFTDVDCPYCRKLHADVGKLNAAGITVRYLAFPRTGLDTETYFKMVSIWCADDRSTMFVSASRGGSVPSGDCANPVAEQYLLGQDVGVTGTPALVFEDGTILPGYVAADRLTAYLLDGTP